MTLTAAIESAKDGTVRVTVVGMKGFDEATTYRLNWPAPFWKRIIGRKEQMAYAKPAAYAALRSQYPHKFKDTTHD